MGSRRELLARFPEQFKIDNIILDGDATLQTSFDYTFPTWSGPVTLSRSDMNPKALQRTAMAEKESTHFSGHQDLAIFFFGICPDWRIWPPSME